MNRFLSLLFEYHGLPELPGEDAIEAQGRLRAGTEPGNLRPG